MKRISISMPDYIHRQYFEVSRANLSSHIVEMYILGVESGKSITKCEKVELIKMRNELEEKDNEIERLKKKVLKLKNDLTMRSIKKQKPMSTCPDGRILETGPDGKERWVRIR